MGAGIALAVDAKGDAADAHVGLRREPRHLRQALDRDLLAQIPRREAELIVRRPVDDEDGAGLAVAVAVALEPSAHASRDARDGVRVVALLRADVQRDDPGVHSSRRTIQKSPWVSATAKPAFAYIESGPTYWVHTQRAGSTSPSQG